VVRRTIVFTALALFAAGAAHAQGVVQQQLEPPPGDDGSYDAPQDQPPAGPPYGGQQDYGGQQGYGGQEGYGAPAEETDPADNPYADPSTGGAYDPTRSPGAPAPRSSNAPTPLPGPGGVPTYNAPPQRGAPPPSYGQAAPPAYGRSAPPPAYGAPGVYDQQAGVGSSCDDIAAELRRFRGPAGNPMQARDEACISARNDGGSSAAFRQCSDRFFQQYEEKQDEYRRCMEQDASKGGQRLEQRALTEDAARNGYGGTAPQMAGPYARPGAPGWLGVQIAPVSPQTAYRTGAEGVGGAYVTNAVLGSPAQQAGLRRGDIIVAFDGEAINQPKDLQYQAERLTAGQQVRLEIVRAGRRETLDVQITPRP
jgi:hypothetical protein